MAREYPERPIVGVGAVVWRGGDVLLVRRAKAPRQGEWSLPGGAQKIGETVADAALREVREETGVTVAITGLVDVVDAILPDESGRARHHYTLVDFSAEWIAGEPKAGSDASEARFVPYAELPKFGLWSETRRIVDKSRRERGG